MPRLQVISTEQVYWRLPGGVDDCINYKESPHYKALKGQPEEYLDFLGKYYTPVKTGEFDPEVKLRNFLKLSETIKYLEGDYKMGKCESFQRCHSQDFPNHVKFFKDSLGRYYPNDGNHRTSIFVFREIKYLQVFSYAGNTRWAVVGLEDNLLQPEAALFDA